MTRVLLAFSRSYLSNFLPRLLQSMPGVRVLHIVQSDVEQRRIERANQTVILNLSELARGIMRLPEDKRPVWREPADMRGATGFSWSPIYADRFLPEFKPAVRDALAGGTQQALEKIFETYRIDGVISEPVALFTTHYLLYLCRRHQALPLLWSNAYFPGFFYFSNQVNISSATRHGALGPSERERLILSVSSYVERVSKDTAGPIYHHKFSRGTKGIVGYLRQRRGQDPLVLSPGITTRMIQSARMVRSLWHRLAFTRIGDYLTAGAVSEHRFYLRSVMVRHGGYDSLAEEFALDNVFFPLQYEPEASLLYAAPDFRNQVAVVESILQALPERKLLWVKEHPNQFGALKQGPWPALRRRYPNLRIVYGRENGRHLIQRCGLAVAITSTAALDALIYGRKCIILGDVFFRNFPGALPLRSFKDVAEALNDQSNYCSTADPRVDLSPLKKAMIEFGLGCYPGDPQPSATLYTDENIALLREAILNELAQLDDENAIGAKQLMESSSSPNVA